MRKMSRRTLRLLAVALIAASLFADVVVFVVSTTEGGRTGSDTTPPVRSDGAPTGALPAGTTSTTIFLRTDEPATCRYATVPGVAYTRMKDTFSTTGSTSHSTLVTGLVDGGTYTYYVRCRDLARNANTDDYVITFRVLTEVSCALSPADAPGNARLSATLPPTFPGSGLVAGTWKVVPSPSVESESPEIIADNTLRGVEAISSADVWAVGEATNPSGPQYSIQTLALHWDGMQWRKVLTPNAPTDWNQLYGVAASSFNDVWAVGTSQDVAYVPLRTLIEHWDGTEWSIVPSPSPGSVVNELRGVAALSASDAWAVGFCAGWYWSSTVILHWDGLNWSRVPSPNPNPDAGATGNELYGITALAANDIWAVGVSSDSANAYAPLALHWDGAVWSVIPAAGLNTFGYGSYFRSISGTSSGDMLAVGVRVYPAGLEGGIRHIAFAAHWDGTAWSAVTDYDVLPDHEYAYSSNFYGVSAVAKDFAWVVGEVTGDAWIFRWTGTALIEVSAPDLPWISSLHAVGALSMDSAWAVGRFAIEGVSGRKTLTERYSVP